MSAAKALMEARAAGVTVRIENDDLVLAAAAPPPAAVLDQLSSLCGRRGRPASRSGSRATIFSSKPQRCRRPRSWRFSPVISRGSSPCCDRARMAGQPRTGRSSSMSVPASPSSMAACRVPRPRPVLSRAASWNGLTATPCARRRGAASPAVPAIMPMIRWCLSEPKPPAMSGCIRAAGRPGTPAGRLRRSPHWRR